MSDAQIVLLEQILRQVTEREALVTDKILPGRIGRVKFAGRYWYAGSNSSMPLRQGEIVRIVGHKGNFVLVKPYFRRNTEPTAKGGNNTSSIESYEDNDVAAPTLSDIANVLEDRSSDSQARDIETHTIVQPRTSLSPKFFERGDRVIAYASGAAFLGGLIAQIPGAIVGALAGTLFGLLAKDKTAKPSTNS